jgi:tight adherence protein C
MDFSAILPFALFGAFAAGAWWIIETLSRRRPRAEERLAEIKNPGMRSGLTGGKSEAMSKLLESSSSKFAKPLKPKSAAEESKLKQRLAHAGFRREAAVNVFLAMKFILLIIGLFMGGGSMLAIYGFTRTTLFRSVIIAGLMFYVPDIIVWLVGRKRKEAIFLSLPDVLDLLVVCVEAGLGLDQAMRRVAEEMRKTYRVICDEFAVCNFHLQMGKTRSEVLHDLGQRTGVDDLRALASILIQADKFGSSVGQALRVQSDSMRTRRRQIAEEKAAKTAVQLIFPLVLFIFPGIFVVLVGPAAITMIREMFPMMQGS